MTKPRPITRRHVLGRSLSTEVGAYMDQFYDGSLWTEMPHGQIVLVVRGPEALHETVEDWLLETFTELHTGEGRLFLRRINSSLHVKLSSRSDRSREEGIVP